MSGSVSSRKMGGAGVSAAALLSYYKEDSPEQSRDVRGRELGQELVNYYEDGTGEHRIIGKLGTEFGLEGKITDEQFALLYAGRDPSTGEQLFKKTSYRNVLDAEGNLVSRELGVRTPIIEVLYTAPKSVSEAFARAATDEEANEIAAIVQRAAITAWEASVEDFARVARVTDQGVTKGQTAKLLGMPALQKAARPTAEQIGRGAPPDPHIHVHIPTFTLAKVGDGWYTADQAAIMRTMQHNHGVFNSEMTRMLMEAGYNIDAHSVDHSRSGRIDWELSGSDPKLRDFWSSRSRDVRQIELEFRMEYGRAPKRQEVTQRLEQGRLKKTDKMQDTCPDRSRWTDDAKAQGFDVSPITPGQSVGLKLLHTRQRELHSLLMGPKGLTINDAVFTLDEVHSSVARLSVGLGMTQRQVAAFEERLKDELILARAAAEPEHVLFTTQAQIDKERFIEQRIDEMTSADLLPVSPVFIKKALDAQPYQLDKEQIEAVYAACSSSAFTHVEGYAGAGKSSSLAAIRDAQLEAGVADQFIVVATAAATAERTGRRLEADEYGSVESLVRRIEAGKVKADERTTWFLDEAAMTDTHRMAEVLKMVGPGRIVVVGDPAQLKPIGAAGWYPESVERHGSTMLTRVHRHRDPRDVRDYELLRRGKAAQAVMNMNDRKRIHVDENAQGRIQRVMRDYASMRDYGYSAAQIRQVLETSNLEVDAMNALVQKDRLSRGELREASAFTVQDNEQNRNWTLYEGDQVIFLKAYSERGAEPIRNGTTGTILKIDGKSGQVSLALGDRIAQVKLSASGYAQPVGLAYAQHVAKYQGAEVEMVQVLPGPAMQTDANAGYSQLTRAKHEAHAYLDHETHGETPLAAISEAWAVPYEKRSALWHQRQVDASEKRGRFTDVEMAQLADAYGDFLAERFSDEMAVKVTQAPAYPYLVCQLDELARNGADSKSMLAAAVEERTLQGVEDPAAVLSWRLERMAVNVGQEHDVFVEPEWTPPEYEVPAWSWGEETYVHPSDREAAADQRRVVTDDYELAAPNPAVKGHEAPGREFGL